MPLQKTSIGRAIKSNQLLYHNSCAQCTASDLLNQPPPLFVFVIDLFKYETKKDNKSRLDLLFSLYS